MMRSMGITAEWKSREKAQQIAIAGGSRNFQGPSCNSEQENKDSSVDLRISVKPLAGLKWVIKEFNSSLILHP